MDMSFICIFILFLLSSCSSVKKEAEPETQSSQINKTESFIGTFECVESTLDKNEKNEKKSDTSEMAWGYKIKVFPASNKFENPMAKVEVDGFQTYQRYEGFAAIDLNNKKADIYIKSQKDLQGVLTLFTLVLDDSQIKLFFRGLNSQLDNKFIFCQKQDK